MPSVDERIVEMKFNNKQFEKGVQESLGSLSALKRGLNLEGAAKGLSEIEKAGNGFRLDGMATAIDHISRKFSALGIAGITVIQNLTNSALAMAKRIASSFTIDPIKTGFAEYETQINAVQTILANTQKEGTNLQQVNAALDELNHYADKTIYNFTEMTRNIGTFTAAGVKLDTAVNAIQGIANLAAISGSTSQQASTAMYQLSQAMASGTVKLMDWNSVVNASMGGQVFQDALMETARVHDIAIDDMIKKQGSFRETLQKGWLTTDVLTETLEKFTATTEGLTETQIAANREMWKARGYTDEQINAIYKLGEMSVNAATKVKTFSQLMDTLKEAAQSGWTQTWETIVGDFEEAKDLYTEISNTLGDIIGKSADSRNERLFGGLASGWKQLLAQGIDDSVAFEETISQVAKDHGLALSDWIVEDESFVKTLKRGWATADIIGESIDKFTEKLTSMSEEELSAAGYTQANVDHMKALQEQVQNGTISLEDFANSIKGLSGREQLIQGLRNSFQALSNIITPIKTAFDNIFPRKTSKEIYAMTEGVANFTKALADGSSAISGKIQNVFEGFFSVIKTGIGMFKTLGKSVITLLSHLKPAVGSIFNFSSEIGRYISSVTESSNATELFGKAIDKLAGFVTPLIDVFSSLVSSVFNNIPGVLKGVVTGFSKLGSILGKTFQKVSNAILNVFSGPDFFKSLSSLFNSGVFAAILLEVKGFMSNLKKSAEGWKGLTENIQGIFDGLTGSLGAMQNSLKADTLMKIAKAVTYLVGALVVLALINPDKLAASILSLGVVMAELVGAMYLLTITVGPAQTKNLIKASGAMMAVAASTLILSFAVKNLSGVGWDGIVAGLLGVAGILSEIAVFSKFMDASKGVKHASGLIVLGTAILILAQAVKQFGTLPVENIKQGLVALGAVLGIIAIFANITKNATNVVSTAAGLTILGAAMLVFGQAIKMLGSMPLDVLETGINALGVSLVGIAAAVKLLSQNGMVSAGIGMIGIAAAMIILSTAIQTVGAMPIQQVSVGVEALSVAMIAIAVAMRLMGNALPGAAALLVVSGAIRIFVPVIKSLGELQISTIAKGLITLALAIGIVGGAAVLLSPAIPAMFGLAGAMALIGVSVLAVSTGVMLFATALASLAAVGAAGAAAIVAALSTIVIGIIQLIPSICVAIGEGVIAIANVIGGSASAISTAVIAVVTAVVTALVTCIPLVVTGALTLITSLLNALAASIPEIASAGIQIIVGLIDAVSSQIPTLINAGINLMVNFINGMADGVRLSSDVILSAVRNLMSAIVEFALTALADLVGMIPGVGDKMQEGLLGVRDKVRETLAPESMQSTGAAAMTGMADGIITGSEEVKTASDTAIAGITTSMGEHNEEFNLAGTEMIRNLNDGMLQEGSKTETAGEDIAGKGATGAGSKDQEFINAGSNAGAGFVQGIISQLSNAQGAGAALAEAAYQAAMRTLAIKSPSRKLMKVGSFAGEGFVIGLQSMFVRAGLAGKGLANTALNTISEAIADVADYIGDNSDLNPRITPVIDLSGVKSGMGSIQTMFGATKGLSLGAVADTAAVSTYRERKEQFNKESEVRMRPNVSQVFNQYNNSPKELSRIEIYRQTYNILGSAREALSRS